MVFPADEGQVTIADIDASISIVDDEINENKEQIFAVLLEVADALNFAKLEQNLSICKIIDDDGKYIFAFLSYHTRSIFWCAFL